MSKFFESELIREELEEINNLQREIYSSILNFGSLPSKEKKEHIEKLLSLLEKQKIMYTRLCLSDDPKAKELKANIKKSVVLMGFPADTDMNTLFANMSKTIESLRQHIDE
jgi:hypothetical protein